MIQVKAAQRLTASLSDDQLADYAERLWAYAKTVGSPLHPNFERWFKQRGAQLYRLSDDELRRIWRAALRMNS